MELLIVLSCLMPLAVVGYFIGLTKGRAGEGAVLGLLLGPVGWLLAMMARDLRPTCPSCLGTIPKGASRCRNCGERIPRCPACGGKLGLRQKYKCHHCGEILLDEVERADGRDDDDRGQRRGPPPLPGRFQTRRAR